MSIFLLIVGVALLTVIAYASWYVLLRSAPKTVLRKEVQDVNSNHEIEITAPIKYITTFEHLERSEVTKGAVEHENVVKANAAFEGYLRAFRSGDDEAAIHIGNLYAFGTHPNKAAAQQVFEMIASSGQVEGRIIDVAHLKILEIRTLMKDGYDPDGQSTSMDASAVWALRDALDERAIRSLVQVANLRGGPTSLFDALFAEEDVLHHDHDIEADERLARALAGDIGGQHVMFEQARQQRAAEYSDAQSVHSTTAQNMAAARLAAINAHNIPKGCVQGHVQGDYLTAADDFRNFLGRDDVAEYREDALKVLTSLTSASHSRYDKSEQEVFTDVWKRINSKANLDRKDDMVKVLAQSMASGYEGNLVVCSTGKIMRMIGSLDAMDADPSVAQPLKPEWVINNELAGIAASIRQKTLAAAGEDARRLYESADGDATMSRTMREELFERTKADYVDAGILKEDDIMIRLAPLMESL